MIKAYAELSQNQKYTKKAKEQAQASGLTKCLANSIVNRNANTRTRTTSRTNYVNRLGL